AQIEALQRERFNLAEAHRVASQMDRFSLDSLHQFELITDALAVDSLAALVQLFEQHVPDRAIIFLPEAHESARNSPYSGNLLGPAHLLRAVCEVATRYHFGNLKEGEDFKRAFEAAGETSFAADSSPTTLSKYGSKYERSYNDGARTQTVLLRPHVSFGSGRANSSVKIYWHVDEANRRFVVGQIGEHLPIAKRF
ncbi:MAG: hypothetical protein M3Y37_00635, partial [Chloroflexota bacterium]|nr:hypothetical protein [Chloroflexota bacterium]